MTIRVSVEKLLSPLAVDRTGKLLIFAMLASCDVVDVPELHRPLCPAV